IYGYKFSGYWGYTRTVREFWNANMDLLGDNPLIDMESWGVRTNLEHRGVRYNQPALIGSDADVSNSQIYNGCVIEGTVKNSILFPGVHVGPGSLVEDSVIFFSNVIGKNCVLKKLISDVNTGYGDNVELGLQCNDNTKEIAVVGWNNKVPPGTKIGCGVTVPPFLDQEKWPKVVESGRVLG
ncbi:MAG: glucose-1-phosphate adenylyltransferase, partial [Spirochaetes bacterium]